MNAHYPPREDDEESALQRAVDSALRAGHRDFHRVVSDGAILELTNPIGARGKELGKLENKGGGVPAPGLDSRYEVCGELGRGGIGRVLRAVDSELDREIAIKVLLEEHQSNRALIDRFIQEAQICSQLTHPSILPVYEIGQWSTLPFFTMKLVEGQNLARLLATRAIPQDDLPRFVSIFEQICQAVAHAHSRGVIHRDLKPANVMVGRFGEVQVMDWGMAKVLSGSRGLPDAPEGREAASVATARSSSDREKSVAGAIMGTLSYLAPEQAKGDVDAIDERSDVFGLGAILCEILSGQPPYVGANDGALRRASREAHLDDAISRLEGCGADHELVSLARRCLSPEPSARPRDGGAVAASVGAYLASIEERVRNAEIAADLADEKATGARRSQRFMLGIAVSLLLALVSGVGFAWVRYEQEQWHAQLVSRIDSLLRETRRLQGSAAAATSDGELESWQRAVASLDPVRALLPGLDAGHPTGVSFGVLERELQDRYEKALAAREDKQRDDAMLRALAEAAMPIDPADDRLIGTRCRDTGYAKAFREYGVELFDRPVDAVAETIRGKDKDIAMRLVAAIDHWAAAKRALNEPDAATQLHRIALESDPDPLRQQVRTLMFAKDVDLKALQTIATEVDPETLPPVSVVLLARALTSHGDRSRAIRLLQAAWTRDPKSFLLAVELGMTIKNGRTVDWNAARLAFTAAVAIKPESDRSWFMLAAACYKAKDFDASIQASRELLKLKPGDAQAHDKIGVALAGKGDMDAAIVEFRTALTLDPKLADAQCNIGSALRWKKDFKGAIEAWRQAIRIDADHVVSHWNLGVYLRKSGQLGAAIESFRNVTRLQPIHVRAHFELGKTQTQHGDLKGAAVSYRNVIGLNKNYAEAFCNLGLVLRQQKEYEASLEALLRGHELGFKRKDWPYKSAEWVATAKRLAEEHKNERR